MEKLLWFPVIGGMAFITIIVIFTFMFVFMAGSAFI